MLGILLVVIGGVGVGCLGIIYFTEGEDPIYKPLLQAWREERALKRKHQLEVIAAQERLTRAQLGEPDA